MKCEKYTNACPWCRTGVTTFILLDCCKVKVFLFVWWPEGGKAQSRRLQLRTINSVSYFFHLFCLWRTWIHSRESSSFINVTQIHFQVPASLHVHLEHIKKTLKANTIYIIDLPIINPTVHPNIRKLHTHVITPHTNLKTKPHSPHKCWWCQPVERHQMWPSSLLRRGQTMWS